MYINLNAVSGLYGVITGLFNWNYDWKTVHSLGSFIFQDLRDAAARVRRKRLKEIKINSGENIGIS